MNQCTLDSNNKQVMDLSTLESRGYPSPCFPLDIPTPLRGVVEYLSGTCAFPVQIDVTTGRSRQIVHGLRIFYPHIMQTRNPTAEDGGFR